jgi:type I restriction enzyme S subunit
MSFPRYPKYKPSGVEWLGDVPEGWEVKRLRFVANLNPSKSEIADLDRGTAVSFLPMESVGDDGVLTLDKEKTIAELETGFTYFRNGDVAIAKITPCYENGKGALMCGLTNGIGFGTTELIVARPMASQINGIYLHYLFISPDFRGIGESYMYGAGGQKRVPDAFVRNFATAIPPLPEQTAIAEFLDRETGKIDGLVAEQRRLMELLKEKRQAVISHAVTKGLNPNAPMKPSGIEWLGDVPEAWEVLKLKFLCKVQTGDKDTENAVEGGQYPFFVRSQTVERINSMAFDCEAVLTAGDGVGVGKVFHYHKGPFDFHQRVYMMSDFQKVSGPFFFHYLRENFFKVALEGGAKSTVDSLRRPMFMNFPVCVPSVSEQSDIVNLIESASSKFDTLTAEAQRAIDLLQERRTALISAAVTGQIDVRQQPWN